MTCPYSFVSYSTAFNSLPSQVEGKNFFHQKDLDNKIDVKNSYVKAFFLHHLLDYFSETRVNINNIDLVFEHFIKNKNNTIFIGVSAKGTVGYIAVRVINQGETPFTQARKVVYIDQVGVKEEFRNQGYGRRLLKEAGKLAKKAGASWLQLDVWDFNKSAQYFFSANGFETFVMRMVKKI